MLGPMATWAFVMRINKAVAFRPLELLLLLNLTLLMLMMMMKFLEPPSFYRGLARGRLRREMESGPVHFDTNSTAKMIHPDREIPKLANNNNLKTL
jgi:hypothetical protein